MTRTADTHAIATHTGKSWEEWVVFLDQTGAHSFDHTAIAKLAYTELEGVVDNPGWWAQSIAVAYEQHIGRRQPGQRADGIFEMSVTKTMPGDRQTVFERVAPLMPDAAGLTGAAIVNERTSVTPKRSYWRCDLTDDTKVTLAVEERGDGSLLTITHSGLASPEAVEASRTLWKSWLTTLA